MPIVFYVAIGFISYPLIGLLYVGVSTHFINKSIKNAFVFRMMQLRFMPVDEKLHIGTDGMRKLEDELKAQLNLVESRSKNIMLSSSLIYPLIIVWIFIQWLKGKLKTNDRQAD